MPRFGVLGSGVVAQMLANGLKRHGYDVRIGSREPAKLAAFREQTGIATGTFAEVAEAADVIVLAVKGLALRADRRRCSIAAMTLTPNASSPICS